MKTSDGEIDLIGPNDEIGLGDQVGEFRYTRHASRMPRLDLGFDVSPCRVAIVGGGPVGLALALGLAAWGIPSVVIEADDTVCIGSRAACISRRSLEIVDRLGALPAFLAKGLAWTGGRSFYKADEVFRFEMPHDERQRLPPMINLQQYYIEQYLVDAIDRHNAGGGDGAIDLRWGSEFVRFEQQPGSIDVGVRNNLGEYRIRTDWLIACDGGQSLVRKALDLPLVGTAYEGRYVIIDIHLPSKHPTERRAWFDPPWNAGSTVLMHRQVDDIWRIDYQLRAGEDTETALQPANVRRFVQKHLDAIGEGELAWETIWTSVYRAGALTLESYRHGRVLFAGNAAHALPIFGVRGLNSGFDDAFNLAWKLALVIRGQGADVLLDSYSQERIEGFHINAQSSMRSTEFMSPPSRGFDLLREAALSLAGRHQDIAGLINPRQTAAVPYPESSLSTPDQDVLPGPAPGYLLPDFPLLEPAGFFTGLLKSAFTLLAVSRSGTFAPAIMAATDSIDLTASLEGHGLPPLQHFMMIPPPPSRTALSDVPLAMPWQTVLADPTVISTHFPAGAPLGDAAIYLLRPDRHIAARWYLPSSTHLDTSTNRNGPTEFAEHLIAALRRACGITATALAPSAMPAPPENRS